MLSKWKNVELLAGLFFQNENAKHIYKLSI